VIIRRALPRHVSTDVRENEMSPIFLDLAAFMYEGKKITRISPEGKTAGETRKVLFVFDDGSEIEKEYNCDHQQFMKWWKGISDYWRHVAEELERYGQ
jgi:hypothetical protein